MAIHHFDQARCVIGADALAVTCHEFNPTWSWYRHGAGASATFEMTDGLVFTYRGCWFASGHITERDVPRRHRQRPPRRPRRDR